MAPEDDEFARRIASKSVLKLHAQRTVAQSVWFGLGMSGLVGWSVAVPTLLGTLLGVWWDRHHRGPHSWTLAFLVVGMVLGCANAWRWVSRENSAMNESERDDA